MMSNLYPPLYVGGYELFCRTSVQALRDRGHQVHVLTSTYKADSRPPREQDVSRRLKIHGLLGHPWLPIHELAELELENNQVLTSLLDAFVPDVVYVWNLSGLSKSILHTLQRRDVPTAICMCDHWIARSENADVWLNWWNRDDPKLINRFMRWVWTLSGYRKKIDRLAPTEPLSTYPFEHIHFCSKALRDLTVAAGFPVRHGAIIHCSVHTGRFTGSPKAASVPLRKLLYVGRLTPDKGVMTAVLAMEILKNDFPGTLSIYGHGDEWYERELKEVVDEKKLSVVFYGAADSANMPGIYAEHDALLFTSEWPEPFAITPLEAMASGLPVIATLTGGSGELFRQGENALTFDAGRPVELARAVRELDRNPEFRVRMAACGQADVRERVSEPVIVDQIEKFLGKTVHREHVSPEPLPA